MSQVRIYGVRERLDPASRRGSPTRSTCASSVDALSYPEDKRFLRFFPLDAEDFYYPAGRTPRYTIVEISMFEGRSVEAKKYLIRLLFERTKANLGPNHADPEA